MSSSAKLLGVLIRPNKAVDECLQLFGGWGYMWEYPLARAYADTRIVKITGGSGHQLGIEFIGIDPGDQRRLQSYVARTPRR